MRTVIVPPRGVNFTAFESRFQTICWRRPSSPRMRGRRGGTLARIVDPFRRGGRMDGGHGRVQHRRRRRPASGWKRHLPGDDARHVEHVVDELGLHLGAALDGVDGLARSPLPRGPQLEHARPAEDGGHRRAQLVGERGQELVLPPVRVLERLLREPARR